MYLGIESREGEVLQLQG